VLFSAAEAGTPSSHPLISHVQVPPVDPRIVRDGSLAAMELDLWTPVN